MIGAECFSVEQTGDVTVVRIVDTRDFDTDNYAQLQLDLVDFVARQQPRELLVDLSNIVFCSTALIAALLMAQKCIQTRPGVMKLFGLSEVVLETLHRLRLVGTLFSVCADEAAARTSLEIIGKPA
ncbi:MAG: STAS domain-containing protein [Pirellulaceae bacterium]|jgi:anti-anti-sigma regulatory factor|nr:STAS domain-containing protein [Pirellulaceae bacterium]